MVTINIGELERLYYPHLSEVIGFMEKEVAECRGRREEYNVFVKLGIRDVGEFVERMGRHDLETTGVYRTIRRRNGWGTGDFYCDCRERTIS